MAPHDAGVRMSRWTLRLTPRAAEQEYFAQYEALDLLNCLIVPAFFANTLAMFRADALSSVYFAVLAVKGYQLGLLLLPGARRRRAHARTRHRLILAERVLRQCVATPLVGRGPGFRAWITGAQAAAAASGSKVALGCKALMLVTGLTINFWNVLLLPLDMPSQVALTTACFLINFQTSTLQTAFVFEALAARAPWLLWLQAGAEHAARGAARLLAPLVSGRAAAAAARVVAAAAEAAAEVVAPRQLPPLPPPQPLQQQFPEQAAAAAALRGAPDVSSLAGRFVIAACGSWMVAAVLLAPLYVAWRWELHCKSQWLRHGGEPWGARQRKLDPARADDGGGAGGGGGSVVVPGVVPPLPRLVRELALLAALALAAGQALVAAHALAPGLMSHLMWRQIIF